VGAFGAPHEPATLTIRSARARGRLAILPFFATNGAAVLAY
jgi:hypothetical protein